MIEAAIGATSHYQQELSESSRQLERPIERETLRIIVEGLIYSTKEIEQPTIEATSTQRMTPLRASFARQIYLPRLRNCALAALPHKGTPSEIVMRPRLSQRRTNRALQHDPVIML